MHVTHYKKNQAIPVVFLAIVREIDGIDMFYLRFMSVGRDVWKN